MIVKNGEILAIDHIAHDNTLSGNGTSAKPVGLSQSTKDLIDSKVKKTDFETYKSSVANQISNINTKITTDESNFESYKSSAANQINTINNKIAADEADFNSYKSSAHNEIANQVSTLNGKITDVANAKQDKGNYVSASDFNSYKSSAHNEIARVDEKIDTTSDNLRDNYYKTSETYNRTEVDEKFANFGGFKFRDPDPTKNNEPKLAPGEVIDPKAIYLTQPAGASQYLQWIWNTEVSPNVWKCIGDTTMDLSDYAKTDDVVQSANNNVQTVENWADNKFETKQDFERVIAGYYTKDEVNTELAIKVNNSDFNAYKTEVDSKFTNTSAWTNEEFATKQNLTDTKAELENTMESVSGDIISKVNTDYRTLNDKIDNVATTLSDDYYTSLEIDDILAASGEYYTKSESDTKYTEKSVFETAINELSSNKLDKSTTANWDVTEYTEGENIKIVGHEISGKDWFDEIAAAVENKVDESELENYYTSSQIDNKFVTNNDFNNLDNEVGAIDADLDTLSGKTVTVIKDSETVKAIRSIESDGTISYTLSAHDGKQADYLWKPTVNAAGDISWELALTGDTPTTANIKGSDGDDGKTPVLSANGTHIEWKYTDESVWNDLGDFKGEPGTDGITPHIGENNHWFIGNVDTNIPATGPQGEDGFSPTVATVDITDGEKTGTEITFTYKDAQGQTQTTVYSAWNGVNGEGATVHFDGIDGIKITPVDTTHFNVGLSATYKTQVEAVSGKQDALTQAQLDYIDAVPVLSAASASWNDKLNASTFNTYTATTAPATFQPKGNYAAKTDLQYVSAGVDYVSGQIPIKVTDLTDSANYYTINQTSAASELTTEFAKYALLANVPTKVTDLIDSADYVKKTDLEGFVTSSDVATQDTDYVMTTTGWKVLSLPGGGMTQVTHDITLTGQGNADDSKLGVAWSALSGNTIASALSAGSATVAANLGTSSFADITGAINAKADATAISDMLTKTEAESTYQTKAGMSDYLTTTVASQTYQPKGNYVTASDITDMATKTWVGQQGYLTSVPDSYATKTYANEASANALTQAESWVETEGYIKSVPDISGNNGLSANGHTVGINNTGIDANKQYAWTTTGWQLVSVPTIPDITANNGLSANGHTVGISTTNIDANKQYAWTTTGWKPVQGGLTGVSANSPISGNGTNASPIGLDITDAYTIDGTNGITAVPDATANKVIVKMTPDVWTNYQHLATSASEWDNITGLSAKSNVNITSAGVTTVTNTSGTTENKFTQYAEVASHPTPRMFLCATADTVEDITGVLTAASGMGAIVFVIESHS